MSDISYVKKITSNEVEKWGKIKCLLFVENDIIKHYYREISLSNNDRKKESFTLLHYLKMKRDYIYLKIYHDNIKKTLANEKLLKYFESTLLAHGFDVRKL